MTGKSVWGLRIELATKSADYIFFESKTTTSSIFYVAFEVINALEIPNFKVQVSRLADKDL